jgi:4-hydroxy-3-methylbut-2-enyl diphosphate reductase
VELCEGKLPVYYVKDAAEIVSFEEIHHLTLPDKQVVVTRDWLPHKEQVHILISAGASCPDAMVEAVIARVASLYPSTVALDVAASA